MTHDITPYDESTKTDNQPDAEESAPPLCLVHYFAERYAYPPERSPKPPGALLVGRVAERRGNLIILEFAPRPAPKTAASKPKGPALARVYDIAVIILLIACLLGCAAAFRF